MCLLLTSGWLETLGPCTHDAILGPTCTLAVGHAAVLAFLPRCAHTHVAYVLRILCSARLLDRKPCTHLSHEHAFTKCWILVHSGCARRGLRAATSSRPLCQFRGGRKETVCERILGVPIPSLSFSLPFPRGQSARRMGEKEPAKMREL